MCISQAQSRPAREILFITSTSLDPSCFACPQLDCAIQVSGDISLACSWRVTPLDVVQLKVKACQAELEQKEEVLALIQERLQMQQSLSSGRDVSRSFPSAKSCPAVLTKRLAALRGVLDLKVRSL
jgi:hypothetical protein